MQTKANLQWFYISPILRLWDLSTLCVRDHIWPLSTTYLAIYLSIFLYMDLSIIYIYIYICMYLYKYISAELFVCFSWLLQQMKPLWLSMKYINLVIITVITCMTWNILPGFNPYVVLWSCYDEFRFPCMTLIKCRSHSVICKYVNFVKSVKKWH